MIRTNFLTQINKFIIILDYRLCRVALVAKKTKNTAIKAFW